MNNAAISITIQKCFCFFLMDIRFYFLSIYLVVKLVVHMVTLFLTC